MYFKQVFDVVTLPQAKHVVLTSDPNNPNKFEEETEFFVRTLEDLKIIDSNSMILDFGCGMGRLSKSIVEKFSCSVIGTDISPSMRAFAMLYVSNPSKFVVLESYDEPETIDVCVASLVLQHVENPEKEIKTIACNLRKSGYLVLLNEDVRFVPSGVDRNNFVIWKDDGFDIHKEISKYLKEKQRIPFMKSGKEIIVYENT